MANRVRQAAQSTYELGYAPREDGEYFGSEYDPEEIARLRAELDDIAKLLFDKEPRVAEKAGMMFLEFDKLFAAYPKSENWELLQKCIPELLKVLGTDNSGPQLWMRIRPPLAFLEVYLPKMPRRGAEYEEELVKLMTQAPNPEVREGVMNKLIILQEDRDYVSEDLDGVEPVIENHIEELVGMLTTEGSGDVRSNIVRLISTSGIFLTRYEAVVAKMLTDAPDAKGRSARSAAIGALGSYLETEKKYLAEIADLVTYPDCTEEVVSILRQEHLVQEYSDILAKVIFMIETLSSGLDITNGWWLAFNAFNSQPYDLLLIHIDAYVPTIQRVQDQPEEPAGFHHGVKKKDVREMLIKALNKDDSYDFIAAAFVKRPARTLHALTVASIFFESESLAFRKSDIAQSDRLYTEARQLQRIVAGFVAAGFCGLSWPSFIVKYVLLETSFGRETCNLLLQHDVKVVMSLPAVQQVVQDLWESRMGSEMEESHAPFWMATCGMICPPMPYLILLALVGAAGWLASDPNVMLLILEVPTAAHLAVAGVNAFAAWLVWASTSNGWGKWLYWDTKAIRMACIATFAVLSAWSLVMSTLLNDSTPLLISEVMEWLGAQALSARVLATAGAALPGVIMIFIRHDSYGTEEDLITQWDYALIACWPLAFAFSALALGPVLSPLLAGCVVVQFVLPMLTLASMPHLWEYVYFIGDKTLFDPGTQISEYMRLPYSVTLLAMFLGPIHILRIPVVKSVIGVTLHFVFAFALTTLPLATLPTPALGGMLVWTIGFVVEEVTELMRKPAARIREPLRVLKFAGLLLAFVAQLATLALVTDEDADRGSGSSLLTMASSVADAEDVLLSIAVFMLILVQGVHVLELNPSTGPLVLMVQAMFANDLLLWVIVAIFVAVLPFWGALNRVFKGTVVSAMSDGQCADLDTIYGAPLLSFWEVVKITVGGGSGEQVSCLEHSAHPLAGPSFLLLFTLVAGLLLTNLLIALFAKTFDNMSDASVENYQLLRAKHVLAAKEKSSFMPPFNLIGLPTAFLRLVMKLVTGLLPASAYEPIDKKDDRSLPEDYAGKGKTGQAFREADPKDYAASVRAFLDDPKLEEVKEGLWRKQFLTLEKTMEKRMDSVNEQLQELKQLVLASNAPAPAPVSAPAGAGGALSA